MAAATPRARVRAIARGIQVMGTGLSILGVTIRLSAASLLCNRPVLACVSGEISQGIGAGAKAPPYDVQSVVARAHGIPSDASDIRRTRHAEDAKRVHFGAGGAGDLDQRGGAVSPPRSS